MSPSEKRKRWQEAKREAGAITDKLGMAVDKDILETVAILRLLDFETVGSCGGHIRRSTGGPYVLFEPSKALRYAQRARQCTDPTRRVEYRRLYKKATFFNALSMQRLIVYLEDFYASRPSQYQDRLIVQSIPMALHTLKCQSAEVALTYSLADRKSSLAKQRAEMIAFAEHLKAKFFSE